AAGGGGGGGETPAAELGGVEDRETERGTRPKQDIGLRPVTDGEFRRRFGTTTSSASFPASKPISASARSSSRAQPKPMMLRVIGKLVAEGAHPMIEHFKFVAAHAKVTPKMTIPSPSSLHFRYGRDAVPASIYPVMEDFYRALGESYRAVVRAFAAAGCRYLQLDEVNFAYLCDPKLRAFVAERGDDPKMLPHIYARMINAAISDVPPDMTKAMHLCHGTFQSSFVARGGYEPVAEILFNEIDIDAYFMEYDSDRAGGFEPLRFVPKGKMVVLGLVTSKSGTLESKDAIKRRIDEAAKFVALEQLCLSPQCGFASSEEGNILAEDEQWAKLRRIVEVADEVWG